MSTENTAGLYDLAMRMNNNFFHNNFFITYLVLFFLQSYKTYNSSL